MTTYFAWDPTYSYTRTQLKQTKYSFKSIVVWSNGSFEKHKLCIPFTLPGKELKNPLLERRVVRRRGNAPHQRTRPPVLSAPSARFIQHSIRCIPYYSVVTSYCDMCLRTTTLASSRNTNIRNVCTTRSL